MKIVVMISGKMRSGKNTFADILIEEINKIDPDKRVRYDFFARPVKEQAKEVFRPLTNYLNAVSESCGIPQLFTDDDNWYEDKNSITRILLQTYGTEIFRDRVDKDYWSKLMRENLEKSDFEIILVTDWRFKNEMDVVEASKEYKTMSVRVTRPELFVPVTDMYQHSSEIDLDDFDRFDVSIINNAFDSMRNDAKKLAVKIIDISQKP